MSENVSVWLIEDHHDFRHMVFRVINQIGGMTCTRMFTTCEEALSALKSENAPDVVLSDVGLPGMNGIAGIKEIKAIAPGTHVIMLTVYDDHDKVFEAICAGASGYLLKNSSEETITNAIQEVLRGGAPMNPRVAKKVLEMFAKIAPQPKKDYGLSDREKEILVLMSTGLMKKEIADQLSLSYHTVSNHLRSIYEKLHVHTHGGAVAKAMREKLL
ncbi:MAG: response regulator receiver [Verrucomicrobiales bacterium]|nr:response regulator receiver [Verrucomicrobiales bacterium]